MKAVTLTLALLATLAGIISDSASADEKQSVKDAIGPTSATPHFVFAGQPVVSISAHGNLTRFEGPSGYDHIGVGAFSEGYVLCYETSRAFDTGAEEAGFAAGTISCNKAKTSCTITRNTIDGRLELRQIITKNVTDRSASIAMTVRNRSKSSITGVVLRRQADPDVDTGGALGTGEFTNWFGSAERESVFAWNPPDKPGEGHAVVLSSIGTTPTFAKVTNEILDSSCSPANIAAAGPVQGDYGVTLEYDFGTLAASKSKSATVKYSRN